MNWISHTNQEINYGKEDVNYNVEMKVLKQENICMVNVL